MKTPRLLAALLLLAALPAAADAADAPLWLRDIAISPDGTRIAFTYKGDIWTVPAAGGTAVRVTATPDDYEQLPVWSPDSRRLAYATDSYGGTDVMIVDAAGGAPQRLTSHSAAEYQMAFTADGSEVIFRAAIQDPAESRLFPVARLGEVYAVSADGSGATRQLVPFAAERLATVGTDGSFVYQDQRGYENEWRKHHTSSATRDIHLYDAASGTTRNLTRRAGEDRDPVVSADGSTLFFLSEGPGEAMNVWQMALGAPAPQPVRLTSFAGHPVRFLSLAPATGMLALGWDGEIYTLVPGGEPQKVSVSLTDSSGADRSVRKSFSNPQGDMAPSPDGKQLAWTHRGDVFVGSADYETSRQITRTPAREYGLSWSKDGNTVYYTSERDGRRALWQARRGRPEDPNFANATIISESHVELPDGTDAEVDRERPDVSPDGTKLAFVEDRNKLMVMDLATRQVTQLTDGSQYPQRDGEFTFMWSPDSRHIAAEIITRGHEPYTDIAIYDTATGERVSVTDTGYIDYHPVWAMDGEAILFLSERNGMRNHASWGSLFDVYIAFLTQDAYDRYTLSAEDYELLKEADKDKEKADEPADKNKDKKKDKKKDDKTAETAKAVAIEARGIDSRTVRLTPYSAGIADMIVTGDAGEEVLWYITAAQDGYDLWKLDLRKGDLERVRSLAGSAGFMPTPDGKKMFLAGRTLNTMNTSNGQLTPVAVSGTLEYDPQAEFDAMLEFVRNEEANRFYVKDMHGVDWNTLVDHYRRFLPHIANRADFAELLSELLGELNVSHTGSGFRGRGADEPTASLGLLYAMDTAGGEGAVVTEVLEDGPFDKASSAMAPGAVVTAVNGEPVAGAFDLYSALRNAAGRKTLVAFTAPGGEVKEEVVKPQTLGDEQQQLYTRWVKRNEQLVDSLSGGRLGYVHIPSMSDNSFRGLYADALGRYNDRDGLVVDIRWNSGGRLHEDIEVMLSGRHYFQQEVRGTVTCDMPSRRWNKPTVMVINEACYSNAHGTPWVYRNRGLGRLVGTPVAGTMTSVNWVTMQEPSLYFGIPVVGYRLDDGSFLENQQLEPDVLVENNDAATAAGSDSQLVRAVADLLQSLK